AFGGKLCGDGRANAFRCTGNDGYFVLKSSGHSGLLESISLCEIIRCARMSRGRRRCFRAVFCSLWRESRGEGCVDARREWLYIQRMPARKIQVGQVWKKNDTAESYLITKVYNEALTTYAVLRKAGAESEKPVKVKVDNHGPAQTLPGYS